MGCGIACTTSAEQLDAARARAGPSEARAGAFSTTPPPTPACACSRRAVSLVPRLTVLVCVGLRAHPGQSSQSGTSGGGCHRQAAQRGLLGARTSGLDS